MKQMTWRYWILAASVGLAALLYQYNHSPALAQTSLGSAESFAVLGGSAVTAAGGAGTVISGDVGVAPGTSITGFPPAVVVPPFGIHANDGAAIAARSSVTALSTSLGSAGPCTPLGPELSGVTVGPGVYCFSSTANIAADGTFTLSGSGTYIFQVGSALTANVGSKVILSGGANPCNVFWRVTSAATLNGVTFAGTVVAEAGVSLGVGANLNGRALAGVGGPVTMAGSNTVGGCNVAAVTPPPPPPPGAPTLAKAFNPASINTGGVSTLTITLSNPNTTAANLTAPLTDTLPSGVTIAATPNAGTSCTGSGAVTTTGTSVTLPVGRSIPAGAGATPGTCTVTVDVTSSVGGSYIDTLPAGALQTSNGNNVLPALATLTVVPPPVAPPAPPVPPALGKSFTPASVIVVEDAPSVGGVSTLTITLSNPNTTVATLTAPLTDTLPSGVVVAATPNLSTTCSGSGAVTATGTTVTLPVGRSIPAGVGTTAGSCTVTVDVTAPFVGSFVNTLPANALQTSNGNNLLPALATLTATASPSSPIPTLSEWGLILLTGLLVLVGYLTLRKSGRMRLGH